MALSNKAQSIRRHRLGGASRLQQALSLRPRVRKLATRPSSRPKIFFRRGCAARGDSRRSCTFFRGESRQLVPSPTKLWVQAGSKACPGSPSRPDADSAARHARCPWRRPPGPSQDRCSSTPRPYPAACTMRSIGGGRRCANRYPTCAISETSAIYDASSRKATRGCALRGRIIVTTAVQAACLHGWHSSRRRRSRRHPAQAGRIWRAMQPNSLVGPSAWCSAAPLLDRWQWAGPSGPWGPVLIMAACPHVWLLHAWWGCWLELPRAALPCLSAKYVQNGSISSQICPKSRPLRPLRRLRRGQSCSPLGLWDDFFWNFSENFSIFVQIFLIVAMHSAARAHHSGTIHSSRCVLVRLH